MNKNQFIELIEMSLTAEKFDVMDLSTILKIV
jgi:hypothetical protein